MDMLSHGLPTSSFHRRVLSAECHSFFARDLKLRPDKRDSICFQKLAMSC